MFPVLERQDPGAPGTASLACVVPCLKNNVGGTRGGAPRLSSVLYTHPHACTCVCTHTHTRRRKHKLTEREEAKEKLLRDQLKDEARPWG